MAKKKKVGIEVSDAKQARELILTESSPFNMLEAYKAARTNLIFTMNKSHENKAIVVTSAMANDGKTTSCINLAITFAQTGSKVIVIDSDMRNPSVHRYMKGVKNAPGLSNVLGGFNTIEESIQKAEEYNNLYIMSAGVIPPNPSELIYSDAIDNLLRELSKDFDYIFLDAPAGLESGFNLASKAADSCIIISTPDAISIRAASYAARNVRKAGISNLRLVINKFDKKIHKSINADEIVDTVGARFLGVIPESREIYGSVEGYKIPYECRGNQAFLRIAKRITGENVPFRAKNL